MLSKCHNYQGAKLFSLISDVFLVNQPKHLAKNWQHRIVGREEQLPAGGVTERERQSTTMAFEPS
jgi:hypothetical protein